ncbi:hypothetical protein M9H77_31670 [Catharanthus roseus]|uniref:Uncharacterized protein n=1 Tax=Catharanthus roseus TaxID=4058 RepID=A0ACC0A329_CATRO|nr:hypothetical protein M9H77_31670 [Catharanthus roseus]
MHERVIWDAWHKRASLRYKDLMYEMQTVGYQPDWMTTAQYTSLCDEWGSELKANTERLHIEVGSSILTNEQLMFEAAGGSNKGHVYSFDSQSTAVTAERQGGSNSSMSSVHSISFAAGSEACIEKEMRL